MAQTPDPDAPLNLDAAGASGPPEAPATAPAATPAPSASGQRPARHRDPLTRPLLALAVIALITLWALWTAGRHARLVTSIPEGIRFELREVAPDDPEARRFDGRLVESHPRLPLPAFIRTDTRDVLHKVRFEIDISRYIDAEDVFDEARDGAPALVHTRPAKSLLIPQAINGADIYLNGVWLEGFAQSTAASRFMWFRPLIAELPRKVLRRDAPNIVTIELTSWEPYFTISPVYIGHTDQVDYVAESIDFIGGSLANASKAFCFLAGLFMLGVWIANRGDPAFGLLGAASLIWSAIYTLALWIYMPASWRPVWFGAFYLCAGVLNVLLFQFVLRYIDRPPSRRVLAILLGVSAAGAVLWPLAGELVEWDLDMFWIWGLLPFQLWALSRLAAHAWRTRSADAWMLLLVLLVASALILHDYNVLMHVVDGIPWREDRDIGWLFAAPVYLTHLALPPLLVVMARVHLSKYRTSVEHVRDANRMLAESLRRREMELAVAHDRQRELERREAGQEERDRIYSELHDGIGSRLVTTIFSVREGRIAHQQLERNLLDVLQGIRDVISETDTTEHREIQNILFDYCINLDSLLSAPDFQVEYDIEDGHECVLLGELSKDLVRIVEESVANTLKYARASHLRIALRHEDTALILTIADEETREDTPARLRPAFGKATGHGLANMRERAARMGADYRFERGERGALTTLRLPLATAAAITPPR